MSDVVGIEYKNVIDFVNVLEEHVFKTEIFFDDVYLKLLQEYFPFKYITIAAYDDKFRLISGIGSNREINIAGDVYLHNLNKQDSTAQYISRNFDMLETDKKILYDNVRELFSDADAEDLFRFAKHNYFYRAILPVSQQYRISVFKKTDTGDFTPEEKTLLHYILIITRSKYGGFLKIQAYKSASKVKRDMLDSMKVGYIVLNKSFQLIDFNSCGIESFLEIWHAQSIGEALGHLQLTLSHQGSLKTKIEHPTYDITASILNETDFYGRIQQYYYYTIVSKASALPGENESGIHFERLSSREMDVLDDFAKGMEYQDICEHLFISEGTVRTHLKSIYRKLGINNQRKLVYEYLKHLKSTSGRAQF